MIAYSLIYIIKAPKFYFGTTILNNQKILFLKMILNTDVPIWAMWSINASNNDVAKTYNRN